MNKEKTMQRICTGCGQQKPLSAFLFIDAKGTRYGNLCADCRGNRQLNKITSQEDEVGRGKMELRIGARERLQIEKNRQQEFEKINLTSHQEKEEKLSLEKEEETLTQQKNEDEKRYVLNRLFLKPVIPIKNLQNEHAQTTNHDQKIEEKTHENEQKRLQKENLIDKDKKEQKLSENTSVFVDLQTHTVSRDNEVIRNFFTLLGASAPAARKQALANAAKNKLAEKNQNNVGMFTASKIEKDNLTSKEQHNQQDLEKNPTEFIKNRWGPKSRL